MDNVRYAIICQPIKKLSNERYEAAVAQLEESGYVVRDWPDKFVDRLRNELSNADEIHLSQFVLGVSIVLMSVCFAAYFPVGWEEDQLLKDLYLIAFKYGVTIISEKDRG